MRTFYFLGLLTLFGTACIDSATEGPIIDPGFTPVDGPDCILITSEGGAPIGTFPDCQPTGQWTASELSETELEFLSFTDTISGILADSLHVSRAFAYPNPVAVNQRLNLGFTGISNDTVRIKLAIVDAQLRIIRQETLKSDGSDLVDLLIDNSGFNPGFFYRIYYQVSGAQETVFMEGFGDIYICRNGTVDSPQDCF